MPIPSLKRLKLHVKNDDCATPAIFSLLHHSTKNVLALGAPTQVGSETPKPTPHCENEEQMVDEPEAYDVDPDPDPKETFEAARTSDSEPASSSSATEDSLSVYSVDSVETVVGEPSTGVRILGTSDQPQTVLNRNVNDSEYSLASSVDDSESERWSLSGTERVKRLLFNRLSNSYGPAPYPSLEF
ncbi:hypothetical protein EIP91_008680 [Steccherinum ochraceum]|uniref:Uncharacterized protein n=1 Tax=Steccherinum ochraceum TaxID=92696 RepID=A0A4R0RFZ1_9APHY|nr:hypothetical protein EIP91_008680 [Steccherinum ochraceum]